MKIPLASLVFLSLLLLAAAAHAQPGTRQFEQLDRDGDGRVTRKEFDKPIFNRIDANKDGVILPEELQAFARQRAGRQQGEVKASDTIRIERDIPYAGTENPRQRLDLYLPKTPVNDKPLPVVVFIHGGGWQGGDKQGGVRFVGPLVESGEYAGVSIGYRLSGEATWPAQIHDCKAAIRWLRAHAQKYNLDPERIGVIGTSAGGHLVAMLGTAGDVKELEGTLGDATDASSRVTCVVDLFGPSDLLALGGRHNQPDSPPARLIGGPLQEHKKLAQAASPISYVSQDDPPFLLIHGTEDDTVPFSQSELLHAALSKSGVSSTLVAVKEGGHGFHSEAVPQRIKQFCDRHLLGRDVTVSGEAIELRGARE